MQLNKPLKINKIHARTHQTIQFRSSEIPEKYFRKASKNIKSYQKMSSGTFPGRFWLPLAPWWLPRQKMVSKKLRARRFRGPIWSQNPSKIRPKIRHVFWQAFDHKSNDFLMDLGGVLAIRSAPKSKKWFLWNSSSRFDASTLLEGSGPQKSNPNPTKTKAAVQTRVFITLLTILAPFREPFRHPKPTKNRIKNQTTKTEPGFFCLTLPSPGTPHPPNHV